MLYTNIIDILHKASEIFCDLLVFTVTGIAADFFILKNSEPQSDSLVGSYFCFFGLQGFFLPN